MITRHDMMLITSPDDAICTPTVVDKDVDYVDGEVEITAIMNCESCDEEDCEYWSMYNA